jgi:potassium-transporting ATPase KdpC subunit
MRMSSSLLRPVLVSSALFMVVTGLAYPLATIAVSQVLLPDQATGSLVQGLTGPAGSAVIGQDFIRPGYFHPRPSVTTAPDPHDASKTIDQPYNAAASAASNLGPISRKLFDQVQARAAAYRRENGLAATAPVPVDAVTASASGLDPDISPANARLQAPRVAAARHQPIDRVLRLIADGTAGPQAGVLGDPRVNVLQLNLALDGLRAAQQ